MINYTYILLSNLHKATLLFIIVDIIFMVLFVSYMVDANNKAELSLRDREIYKKKAEVYKKYLTAHLLVFFILLLLFIVTPSEYQLKLLYNIK